MMHVITGRQPSWVHAARRLEALKKIFNGPCAQISQWPLHASIDLIHSEYCRHIPWCLAHCRHTLKQARWWANRHWNIWVRNKTIFHKILLRLACWSWHSEHTDSKITRRSAPVIFVRTQSVQPEKVWHVSRLTQSDVMHLRLKLSLTNRPPHFAWTETLCLFESVLLQHGTFEGVTSWNRYLYKTTCSIPRVAVYCHSWLDERVFDVIHA